MTGSWATWDAELQQKNRTIHDLRQVSGYDSESPWEKEGHRGIDNEKYGHQGFDPEHGFGMMVVAPNCGWGSVTEGVALFLGTYC